MDMAFFKVWDGHRALGANSEYMVVTAIDLDGITQADSIERGETNKWRLTLNSSCK